jgi:enoyl-CoA hydratase
MASAMLTQLAAWAGDDDVAAVLLTGAGGRGLCAGGDIVAIHRDIPAGGRATADFWRTEYELNALIHRYPKPYVAFMDGLVLGGGVGVSAHGSHRIVTERTRTGMPETTIGFAPDVGGTYLLARAPGETGTHAALTSAHLDGADALYLGLADHFVPAESLPGLAKALEDEEPDDAVARFAQAPPASSLAAERRWIDADYAHDSVEEILAALRESGGAAADAARTLVGKSPTALKVTLAALRRAARLDSLEEGLDQDFRVGVRMLASPDFPEGIRAQVIDKDRTPRWSPRTLEQVSASNVEDYFAPLEDGEHGGELGLAENHSVSQESAP